MSTFELKPEERDLNTWAKKYWEENPKEFELEQAAFDAGKRILEKADFSAKNLENIVHWKSPRVVHHIGKNNPEKIETALQKAIDLSTSVQEAVSALSELCGVGVPMASAILTAIFPDRYTIIDFRALEALGHRAVEVEFYEEYLNRCQGLASDLARNGMIHRQTDYPPQRPFVP